MSNLGNDDDQPHPVAMRQLEVLFHQGCSVVVVKGTSGMQTKKETSLALEKEFIEVVLRPVFNKVKFPHDFDLFGYSLGRAWKVQRGRLQSTLRRMRIPSVLLSFPGQSFVGAVRVVLRRCAA